MKWSLLSVVVVVVVAAAVVAVSGCAPVESAPAPAAPTVVLPETPTRTSSQLLRGTKPAATAIEINDVGTVALDGATTWQATVGLTDGANELRIVAVDALGQRSPAALASIVLDRTAPVPPVAVVPDYPTLLPVWPLTGSAERGAAVYVDGRPADVDDDGSYSLDVPLLLGTNDVRITAVDALGNESSATRVVLSRTTFALTMDAVPALVRTASVQLGGYRGPGVAVRVDGALAAAATASGGPWSRDVSVVEGENAIMVRGEHPEASGEIPVVVVRDSTPPVAPTLDALPTLVTDAVLPLTGQREAGSAVVVNGVIALPVGDATAFATTVTLPLGASTLDVRARDAAGNESAPVSPAPELVYDPRGLHLVVDPVAARVPSTTLALSGEKAGGAVVRAGAALLASADGSTTWSGAVTLAAGANDVVVTASFGPASTSVVLEVEAVPSGPTAPSVTLPTLVREPLLVVSGVKPARTSVLRDASRVAALDDGTAFTDEVTLAAGDNTLSYVARDEFGRTSAPATAVVTLDQTAPIVTLAEPEQGEAVGRSVVVAGSASDDEQLAAVEVCFGACASDAAWLPATLAGAAFSTVVDLTDASFALVDGDYGAVRARARDAAGNVGLAPPRDVMVVRDPLAVSADPSFSSASDDVDLAAGPEGELFVVFPHAGAAWLVAEGGLSFGATPLSLDDDGDYGASSSPRVAAGSDGSAHVVWLSDGPDGSNAPGSPGVVYRSYDGVALSSATVLEGTGACSRADLAVSPAGLVAVTWRREIAPASFALELVVFDGSAWSAPLTVADAADGQSAAPDRPALAFSDDDTLHIVWQDAGAHDGAADDMDVLYRRFTEAGGLDATTHVVSDDSGGLVDGDSRRARVAAVGPDVDRTVWIGWIEAGAIAGAGAGVQKAAVRSWSDLGSGAVVDASSVSGRASADELDVAVTGTGKLAVAWVDTGDIAATGTDPDVFLRRRFSTSFEAAPVVVSDLDQDASSTGISARPRLALDALGNAHVVWLEASDLAGTIAGALDVDVLYFAVGENQP